MCLLFETLRLGAGGVDFLAYHQLRVDRSVGPGAVDLAAYIAQRIEPPAAGCLRLRITYNASGIVTHELLPYAPGKIETLRLVVDNQVDYTRKWVDRSALDRLYGLRDGCDEVLIVRRGWVTDTSRANVALWDGSRWVTPCEPLLAGTCRARLIDQGLLTPVPIAAESLSEYQKITLINALRGFDPERLATVVG